MTGARVRILHINKITTVMTMKNKNSNKLLIGLLQVCRMVSISLLIFPVALIGRTIARHYLLRYRGTRIEIHK